MASLGHVAVGMAAARFQAGRVPSITSMAAWSALSLLPDADVVGFLVGVEYADPWGHRGATHSLVFSVAVGLILGVTARWFNRPALHTALIASGVLVSHALLDTMTDGGLGCALLWPFDLTRYFAPWRPIPVAPIGLEMLSAWGAIVVLAEIVIFAPVFWITLRSTRQRTSSSVALFAAWFGVVAVLAFSGTARETVTGFILRERTVYAAGYSDAAFRSVALGQSAGDVHKALGQPLTEFWLYGAVDSRPPGERPASMQPVCEEVVLESGVVLDTFHADACRQRGITRGVSTDAVRRRLGPPAESCWRYTKGRGNAHFRERLVCMTDGKVRSVVRGWT
jgi:inner membrane protein